MTGRLFILSLLALGLAACATYQKPLIDDAYYWPDDNESVTLSSSPAQSKSAEPSIEVLNVQDTTITVRIKR